MALAEIREAIRLEPGDARALIVLAAALLEQKQPEEAIAAARDAIRLRPGDVKILLGVGSVLEERRKAGRSNRQVSRGDPAQARRSAMSHVTRSRVFGARKARRGHRRVP